MTFKVDSNRKCNFSRRSARFLTLFFERQLQLLTTIRDPCPFQKKRQSKRTLPGTLNVKI